MPQPDDESYGQDQPQQKTSSKTSGSPEHAEQQDSAEPFQKKNRSPEDNKEKMQPPSSHAPQYPGPPQRHAGIPRINRPLPSFLPVVEEPICVLKIELDGEHIEEIKVFENDDPNQIVQKFGNDFNLSQNARQRLLEQIQEQIQMDDD